jgi:hypothetical protein
VEPVLVAINTANTDALRAECKRLGIAASERTNLATLRKSLRTHRDTYNMWRKFCTLATMMFGEDHTIDTRTVNTIQDGIYAIHYQRLMREGYVHVDGVDGSGLYEEKSGHTIYILERIDSYNVRVRRVVDEHEATNDSCSIMHVSRLAFADVDAIYLDWEQNCRNKK